MNTTQTLPNKWDSKGKTISKSAHHHDMFIVDHPDGTFHTVSSGHQMMVDKYPVTQETKPKKQRRIYV